MSQLYFFRHAQASYLADNYDQLSKKGEKQSLELGKYLVQKKLSFDQVFVGPLQRQQHTCKIVAEHYAQQQLKMPRPVCLEALKEHSGPKGVRKVMPELMERYPQIKQWHLAGKANPQIAKRNSLLVFQKFMNEWVLGNIEVPGIESWADFRRNVKNALDTILQQTGKGEQVAVFTSGGTISSIIAESLQLENEQSVAAMNFSIRNTSFSQFFYSNQQFNVLSFNELPHLEPDLITFV